MTKYHVIVRNQSNKLITFKKVDRIMAANLLTMKWKIEYPNYRVDIKPFI